MEVPKVVRKDLTREEQNTIAQWLLQHSNEGKLAHGAKKVAAEKFGVSLKTIWKLWKKATCQQEQGMAINLKSNKAGAVHKKIKKFDANAVRNLSVLKRTSLRVMAGNLGVSKSLVHIWVKNGSLKPHTNAIKPFLTPQNQLCRLEWSLSQLGSIIEGGKIRFQTMYNTVHVDEKWFYLTKTNGRYYLAEGEEEPHRSCKSKRFIDKIMFNCAVSRPIIDTDGTVIFDGKIGIFPFITQEPAQRNSKNRERGTLETKAMNTVSRSIVKEQLINEVVPAIKAKWPNCLQKKIVIQQDNAKPHILESDQEFQAVAKSNGFNIQLICQPPNSPDTNVNDLGFFRSIQSLKDQKPANSIDELLHNVMEAFQEYEPEKLNKIFLTLQCCYEEIIKVKGSNKYKIPHKGKDALMRKGKLPECIAIDEGLVRESLDYLQRNEDMAEKFYNVDHLAKALQEVGIQE